MITHLILHELSQFLGLELSLMLQIVSQHYLIFSPKTIYCPSLQPTKQCIRAIVNITSITVSKYIHLHLQNLSLRVYCSNEYFIEGQNKNYRALISIGDRSIRRHI